MRIVSMIIGCLLLLLGCVKNDFPYPTIKCAITDFGVDGMTSVKIDASARTVVAKVVDTLDLSDLRVNRLEVTEKTTVIPDDKACIDFTHFPDTGFVSVDSLPTTANTRMSFKEPVNVLLRLYQDYPWTITVLHDIERVVKVNNMVSPALIDEVNHNVVILVD